MDQKVVDYKYKERKPAETVEIIKKFFTDRGFVVTEEMSVPSEAKTHSCHLKLWYDGDFIMFSNGKGAEKDLAFASGYAELYERFCNGMKSFCKKNLYKKIKEVNYKNFGYYVHPDEKFLTYDEALSEPLIKKFLLTLSNNKEENMKRMVSIITDDEYIGIPYTNVLTKEIKHFDPQLLIRVLSSTGMCAGNSFEEAFNEGFSEIIERFVDFDLISSTGLDEYCIIDIDKLEDEILKSKVESIKKAGFDFYLIDFSYEYNIPVMAGLLVDRKNHMTRLNFGSFPIFEVAAMRTITEVYQNIDTYNDRSKDLIQVPAEKSFNSSEFFCFNAAGLNDVGYMPPHFCERMKKVDTYNHKVFLPKGSTIMDTFQYYRDLIKENGLNVWYTDNSLMNELVSLHIYVDNLPVSFPISDLYDYDKANYDRVIERLLIDDKYGKIIESGVIDYTTPITEDCERFRVKEWNDGITDFILYSDTMNPLAFDQTPPMPFIYNDLINNFDILSKNDILQKYEPLISYETIKKYFTILRYKKCKYEYEEAISHLTFLGIDCTPEDWEQIEHSDYFLMKTIVEPFIAYYHSDKYEQIVLQMIKK